jgi:Uma2 family endonuclease
MIPVDKNFNKAVDIIVEIKNKNKFIYDIHSGNFMFRRGKFGIQLVFIDPLV